MMGATSAATVGGLTALTTSAQGVTAAIGSGGSGGGGVTGSFAGLMGVSGPTTAALYGLAILLGGSLVVALSAVAASAIAATGALVALGVAAGGALFVGIGFAAVAIARFKQQSEIAGTAAYELRRAAGRTGDTIIKAFGPGIDAAFRGMTDALRAVRPLIRSLAGPITMLGQTLGRSFEIFTDALASPEMKKGLQQLILGVSRLVGPGTRGLVAISTIMLNIANAAMPYLVAGFRAIAGWLAKIAGPDGALGLKSLQGVMAAIVPHLRAWFQLGAGISRVFLAFLRVAAPVGLQMVNWLTRGANALARWMNTREGQMQMRQFFAAVMPLAREIVISIARATPVFLRLFAAVAPGMTMMFQGFNRIIRVIAGVVNAFGPVFPILSKIGAAVGVYLLGPFIATVALVDSLVGKIQGLLDKIGDVKGALGSLPGSGGGGLLPGLPDPGDFIPGFAGGGVLRSGAAFVGETGPELLRVGGGVARVDPLSGRGGGQVDLGAAMGDIFIEVVSVLDGQVAARSTGKHVRRRQNRA